MDERDYRDDRRPPRPRSTDPRDSGDIVRGRDGRPLVDRFGRPVRRRPDARNAPQRRPRRDAPPPAAEPTRYESPRQYIPPREVPRRPQPVPSAQPVPRSIRPQPAAVPRKRRRAPRPGGCLRSLGGLLAVVLVLGISMLFWVDSKLTRVEATPSPQVANTAGTNWLLVGSDSRQGMSEEDVARLGTGGDIGIGRTDTIMVLHIPNGGQARLVSLPRDSYVSIPGYGEDKINAAFTYGGPTLLASTVEQATGLRIDHYAEIGMGGLANVVDAIGGVELCPTEPINDPLANLNIVAGCQKMDGPTALGYVRTRATAMGDLDRVDRQREFFGALMTEATRPSTLLNPFEFFPLVSNTANSFTVGKGDHAWHLARVALAMRSGVTTETVPVAGFADYAVGNVVLWDDAGAQALWSSMK
ncbi:Regulatory protein MsrR [Corynebacterium atrinae]|uniref:LCP family protein n=1 Tax=Corynebacterium atrinae TaxID=1336740 RepID=UPI0025B5E312|nr:LCP family protein [Corynebacterium atrinae]WJY64559.1 Regulatory protein MsrR [Corynebacterium atrinae]